MTPWPFKAVKDGPDIVVNDILVTCFGGWGGGNIADRQDEGDTASGVNTKEKAYAGCSIAMDGRQFSTLRPAEHRALDFAPIPRLLNSAGLTAWHTPIVVTIDGVTWTPPDGLIDLGPGLQATPVINGMPDPKQPHALDLTPLAAMHWEPDRGPRWLSNNFEKRGSFRIPGMGKFLVG